MPQTLLYRLFKIGRIPQRLKSELESEGIRLQDEGIPGSVTYLNFRSPRRVSAWRRVWFTGAIVVTQTRLVALGYSQMNIDVPFSDQRFCSLNLAVEQPDKLQIAFDASLFHDDWSGSIEYRFRTSQAQAFLDALKKHCS